jgi:hypothetical protein
MANPRLDLTGKQFGDVLVVSPAGVSKKGASLWNCECKRCGKAFVATGHRLTAKRSPQTDCGCSYRERKADLSGRTFGSLEVLSRDGSYPSGDSGYLCRCLRCGREKRFPACTIRTSPKGCGCLEHDASRLSQMSPKGVAVSVKDGTQIYTATREAANANSTTGLRWVRVLHRPSGDFICAAFYIKGKRYYKGGFLTPASAHEWASKEHRRILDAEGITDPRTSKED